MKRTIAVLVVLALALLGYAPVAPRSQQSTAEPAVPTETAPNLRDVQPSSAEEKATLAAFEKTRGNPGGGHPVGRFRWTRVSAGELPRHVVPADSLGRDLLEALVVSSALTTPTAAEPITAAELLLEDGLVISAARDRRVPRDVEAWNRIANGSVAEVDRNFSTVETATVGGSVALIRVGAALSGFTKTATNVEWVVPPWRYSVELRGEDVPGALRVARSLGEGGSQ